MPTQEAKPIGNAIQIFADEYFISEKRNVSKLIHTVEKHPENPLIVPETRVEQDYDHHFGWDNGSVIYDPDEDLYRAYIAVGQQYTVYAESPDGIEWSKPGLEKVAYEGSRSNNILLDSQNASVMYHRDDEMSYTFFVQGSGGTAKILQSEDGLSLDDTGQRVEVAADSGQCVFDPHSGRYINVSKDRYPIGKVITNPLTAEDWEIPVRVLGVSITEGSGLDEWTDWKEILRPDETDHEMVREKYPAIHPDGWTNPPFMRPEFEAAHEKARETGYLERLTVPPQKGFHHMDHMNLIVLPYANVYLGLLQTLYSTAQVFFFGAGGEPRPDSPGQDGPMDVQLVCSRDLETWTRLGSRDPIIPLGDVGDWDRGMVMPFSSNSIVRDGELWIYYAGARHSHMPNSVWNIPTRDYPDETMGIGLATIRKDGFVSMRATDEEGLITTDPLSLEGDELVLNADATNGSLRVGILDPDGTPIPGRSLRECDPVTEDSTCHEVRWGNGSEISNVIESPIRLQFEMKNTDLYSFHTE